MQIQRQRDIVTYATGPSSNNIDQKRLTKDLRILLNKSKPVNRSPDLLRQGQNRVADTVLNGRKTDKRLEKPKHLKHAESDEILSDSQLLSFERNGCLTTRKALSEDVVHSLSKVIVYFKTPTDSC